MERIEMKPHFGVAQFEKRMHRRFLLNLPVEYYRVNSDLNGAGYTLNASEGGLMIYLSEKPDIGQFLRLKLFFSFGPDIDAIDTISQVVWVDELGEDENYRCGVRFVDVSSEDMNKLKNFFKKIAN